MLLIERSKESRNPAIKRDLLMRALSKLSDLPLLQPPTPEYKGQDRQSKQVDCRRRCVIWAELIRSASSGKMEDIVRTAAPYCLHAAWTPEVDREMVLLQVRRGWPRVLSFVNVTAFMHSRLSSSTTKPFVSPPLPIRRKCHTLRPRPACPRCSLSARR